MTVAELIEHLKEYDGDMKVYVSDTSEMDAEAFARPPRLEIGFVEDDYGPWKVSEGVGAVKVLRL